MKFLIFFALALATVSSKDLHSRSIKDPVLENEGRIVNGQLATPAQFKYQVNIAYKESREVLWCGGSLISHKWILTAAHCTAKALWVKVFLGATKRSIPEKYYTVLQTDIITHRAWDPSIMRNDISLIRIPATAVSSKIAIVNIPKNNDNKYLGESVVVAGWGQTSDNNTKMSVDLRYAILKVSPETSCVEKYPDHFIDKSQICVATPNKVSACSGDSGSPLVLEGQNIQIGVLSFGDSKGCAKESPIAFTRVSDYLVWIRFFTEIE